MNEEEFIDNAVRLLTKECSITDKQAEAIANLTVILEKNKISAE